MDLFIYPTNDTINRVYGKLIDNDISPTLVYLYDIGFHTHMPPYLYYLRAFIENIDMSLLRYLIFVYSYGFIVNIFSKYLIYVRGVVLTDLLLNVTYMEYCKYLKLQYLIYEINLSQFHKNMYLKYQNVE
jgi:hypothetical protein